METVTTKYLGYDLKITDKKITAVAPNGDMKSSQSMVVIRRWVRTHSRLDTHALAS